METVFYTPREVADLLKLRTETIYEYVREGKLRAVRLGNRYRISKADLEAFLAKARTEGVEG